MKVEIWSDVMCPFCYIGKRKFEIALAQFEGKNEVEVEWKSFQLNPNLITNTQKSTNEYLAEIKGWTKAYTEQMSQHVANIAKQVGLDYHLDKAVVANSFDAHRFSHLAKKHGLQNEAEEALFKAYFTEDKNTDDKDVLVQLGLDIGLNAHEIEGMLSGQNFTMDVNADILEAQSLGINGVPFFLFESKYAISGAQDPSVFLSALRSVHREMRPIS
jgi:predicted DsbA family dithiol-disulfide isomerase